MDINRRTLLKGGAVAGAGGIVGSAVARDASAHVSRSKEWEARDQADPEPYDESEYTTHRVAQDGTAEFETIQAAVNEATPKDLILVAPGTYTEEVKINSTPQLTIRGESRRGVVIDGEQKRYNGIVSTTEGTVVENLTVKDHKGNGVYWTDKAHGYRGSHITSIRNHKYGIYAFDSKKGRFEHCYGSGSDDSAYYIGSAQPGDAVVTNCLAEENAQGFSGTNTGGNVVIKNSVWRNNGAGIVPNTLDSQNGAPQGHIAGGVRIENNEVYDNNNLSMPMIDVAYAIAGSGIVLAGGVDNDVCDNTVRGHNRYGIAVIPIITGSNNLYRPKGNAVMKNDVQGSGRADLALAAPAKGNAFANNSFGSSRPAFLQRRDGSFGDVSVFLNILKDFLQASEVGSYPDGKFSNIEDPDSEEVRKVIEGTDGGNYEMDDPANEPPKTPVGDWEPGMYA
jgi:hypothetical protein